MPTFQLQLSIRVLNNQDGSAKRELVVVQVDGKDALDAGRKAVKEFLPELVDAEKINEQLEIPTSF